MELHRGLDLRAPVGTPVLAVIDGVIGGLWTDDDGGLCLRLCGPTPKGTYPDPSTYFFGTAVSTEGSGGQDDSGWRISYAHLNNYAPNANLGAVVQRGDVIAFSGATGTYPDGRPVDPHLHISCEWLQDGLWDSRVFVDPAILMGKTIARKERVHRLPPGKFVAPNSAVIVPAGQPGATGKLGSVVINVGDNGVAAVNMGNGASVAGQVTIPLSAIGR